MTREELVENILKLWADGHTARRVGELVGMTRNAIIGIVNRAKYSGVDVDPKRLHYGRNGRKPGMVIKKRGPAPRSSPMTRRQLSILSLKPDEPEEAPMKEEKNFKLIEKPAETGDTKRWVPILETSRHSCRYSVDKKFCNAPPHGKHYWCAEHYRLIYHTKEKAA
jgi:hypothetical protein